MKRIWAIGPGTMRSTTNLWLMVPERNIWYLCRRYRMMRECGITKEWARYVLTDLLIMGTTIEYCHNYGRPRT